MIKFSDIEQANRQMRLTPVRGKDYAEVNQRVKAFRMVYPTGFIKTDIVVLENGLCVIKSTVGYYGGDEQKAIVLGTGTAYEKEGSTLINKTSYIENCETSAVGRALGMAGFGIDTAIASVEELKSAIEAQNETDEILVCADCGNKITPKEHDWSVKRFNRKLCRNCQIKVQKEHEHPKPKV